MKKAKAGARRIAENAQPFNKLAAGVGSGSPAPAGWVALADCPLLIIAGVTGVGKSTVLQAIREADFDYHLLPDRRKLTDLLIIPNVQAGRGEPQATVRDRQQRFEYTRAYRDQHAGGMAYALSLLSIDPQELDGALLFDGLRGANEVTHAASLLPFALFVLLEAPDVTRVARLMGRDDPFDQIGGEGGEDAQSDQVQHFADVGAPQAGDYFSHLEEQALLELVRSGAVTADALNAALAIVLEERRSYDPAATHEALLADAPFRTLVVDTQRNAPQQVAAQVIRFVQQRM